MAGKSTKLKRWNRIEVEWNDARVSDGGYDPDHYIRDYTPCVRRTVGYFLGWRLGTLFIGETDDRDSGTFNGVPLQCERINEIPEGMIRSIKLLIDFKEAG